MRTEAVLRNVLLLWCEKLTTQAAHACTSLQLGLKLGPCSWIVMTLSPNTPTVSSPLACDQIPRRPFSLPTPLNYICLDPSSLHAETQCVRNCLHDEASPTELILEKHKKKGKAALNSDHLIYSEGRRCAVASPIWAQSTLKLLTGVSTSRLQQDRLSFKSVSIISTASMSEKAFLLLTTSASFYVADDAQAQCSSYRRTRGAGTAMLSQI